MGKFKVGDRVRHTKATDCFAGKIATVVSVDDHGLGIKAMLDDGTCGRGPEHLWELVEPATEELATLRAFREQALARYPDLAEPESDSDAAYRLTKAYEAQPHGTPYDLARDAIAWARANPRQS